MRASETDIADKEGTKNALRTSDCGPCLIITNAGRAVANQISARRTRCTTILSEIANQTSITSFVDIVAGDTRGDELRAGKADISN